MYELDHVALVTSDLPATVEFYVRQFGAQVLYQDATWAFLKLGQGKLALVTPGEHPPHVALRVDSETLQRCAAEHAQSIATHRDATRSIYIQDPVGHVLELICYPS